MDDDDEPLYGPNYGSIPFTPDELAFAELQQAVAESRLASKKYESALSNRAVTRNRLIKPDISKVRSKNVTSLRHALTKAQYLHQQASGVNNTIYMRLAGKYMKDTSEQLQDLQSGGSRRRRIKSAHKKSKRHKKTHKKTHRRKH
jgi:hypothetical protein